MHGRDLSMRMADTVGCHAYGNATIKSKEVMSKLQEVPCGTTRHTTLQTYAQDSFYWFAYLVVRGASTVEVAINGIHLKGIGGPLPLHGGLHIVVTIEGNSALLVVPAQTSYDHRVLVLHWPADLDLSSCSTALPLTTIIDSKLPSVQLYLSGMPSTVAELSPVVAP